MDCCSYKDWKKKGFLSYPLFSSRIWWGWKTSWSMIHHFVSNCLEAKLNIHYIGGFSVIVFFPLYITLYVHGWLKKKTLAAQFHLIWSKLNKLNRLWIACTCFPGLSICYCTLQKSTLSFDWFTTADCLCTLWLIALVLILWHLIENHS